MSAVGEVEAGRQEAGPEEAAPNETGRARRVDGRPPKGAVITVSPMLRRHLREVLAIERLVYPKPWSSKLFDDELGRRGRLYLVSRSGSELVGYAGVLMIADDAHVATVAVHPDREGEGIATRLLVELVRGAVRLGARQLTLEVRASNERAHRLYRRFGFAPAGARKAYYSDNGEDALVMWAHDVDGTEHRARVDAIEASLDPATVRRGLDAEPAEIGAPAVGGGRMG